MYSKNTIVTQRIPVPSMMLHVVVSIPHHLVHRHSHRFLAVVLPLDKIHLPQRCATRKCIPVPNLVLKTDETTNAYNSGTILVLKIKFQIVLYTVSHILQHLIGNGISYLLDFLCCVPLQHVTGIIPSCHRNG